jgi:hypothetical protein
MLVLFSHMFFSISEHLCGWASEVIASVLLLVLFIEFCPYFYLVGFGLRTGLGQLRFLAPVKSAEDFPFFVFLVHRHQISEPVQFLFSVSCDSAGVQAVPLLLVFESAACFSFG